MPSIDHCYLAFVGRHPGLFLGENIAFFPFRMSWERERDIQTERKEGEREGGREAEELLGGGVHSQLPSRIQ